MNVVEYLRSHTFHSQQNNPLESPTPQMLQQQYNLGAQFSDPCTATMTYIHTYLNTHSNPSYNQRHNFRFVASTHTFSLTYIPQVNGYLPQNTHTVRLAKLPLFSSFRP